ncbi:MAG: hypothetical protein HQL69_16645 [Magnetococcales bacterium]|nr:hypothetical protein [Magnetococcales bacterium]
MRIPKPRLEPKDFMGMTGADYDLACQTIPGLDMRRWSRSLAVTLRPTMEARLSKRLLQFLDSYMQKFPDPPEVQLEKIKSKRGASKQ